jgi:hypothetical protein
MLFLENLGSLAAFCNLFCVSYEWRVLSKQYELKLASNSTMWTDKSEICPLYCSIKKRRAICRFGYILHLMRKRWK